MSFNIVPTRRFEKEIKRLIKKFPSLKKEYSNVLTGLRASPTTGTSIGNDCYKIHLAIADKNKGKSGGARVITYVIVDETTIFLLTIFDKSEQDNVGDKELKAMIKNL